MSVCPRIVTTLIRRRRRTFVLLLGLAAASCLMLVPLGAQQSVITDYGFYPEPALPALPAAGGVLVDPAFGTTIMRLTDANDGTDCRVEYSYWPTFNMNSTRAKALCVVNGVDRTKIWTFDPTNFKRGTAVLMSMVPQSTDPIWSNSNADLIYGHSINHLLVSYNAATQTTTTIKDFSSIVPSGGQLQQMSMSSDDDVFAFHLTNSSGSAVGYIVWKRSTNAFLLNRAETGVDEVQIDKSGRYLEVGYTNGGNRIWDVAAQTSTSLTWGVDGFFHHDSGHGTIFTYNGNQSGFAFRSLATPHNVLTLLTTNTSNRTGHLSMRADNEAWGLVSHYNNDGSKASGPFQNELFQVATDGSGAVRRIAHHGSVYNDYYDAPFANISRDGRFVAFSSNWGNANGRRDVFIAHITPPGSSTTTTPPPVLSCPAPPVGAFAGCYYDGSGVLTVVRTDSYPLAFDWGTGSPDPLLPVDYFSAKWNGTFTFNAGQYTFTATSDDGMRLYVDGQLVMDHWFNQPATTYTVTRSMTAGSHAIRLDYYEAYAGAMAKLSWANTTASPSGDTIAPTVAVTDPISGTTVRNTITLSASATDNVGVAGVQLAVDGVAVGTETAGATATMSWDSRSVPNGQHKITAIARDAAGNRTTSAADLVNISNKHHR
jgi:hypothetical protein